MLLDLWVIAAFAVGLCWYQRGLNLALGCVLSFVLTPPVSLAICLLLPPNRRQRALRNAPRGQLRYCPACRDVMPINARICPACYRAVPSESPAEPRPLGGSRVATLEQPRPNEFTIHELPGRHRPQLEVREVDPHAPPATGSRDDEPPTFPLDLAIFAARQRRARLGGKRDPILVRFLDGPPEEVE